MDSKALLLLVTAIVAAPLQPVAAQDPDPEIAIRQAVHAFKAALTEGDREKALGQLHADVQIFEGGHAETKDEYAAGHLRADMAFAGAVERTTTWSEVHVHGDVAVYLSRYTTKGTVRDREIDSQGTETIVLRMTGDGWKIVHIHWSSR